MENRSVEKQFKIFNRIGAISVFIALLVMLSEIFLTLLPDGARVELTIEQLYEIYNRNWFMAMRNMGLMNIFASTLMIPVFFSLYLVHREQWTPLAAFSLIVSLISYGIFMADNVAFPFLELAGKFHEAGSETSRTILLAAGESLFAKGASHTPGTFPGFFLGQLAGILFSVLIIKGRIFRKATGIIGLIAFAFLLLFEFVSSFVGALYEEALILAMIGGILALVWYVMIGLGLLKQSR